MKKPPPVQAEYFPPGAAPRPNSAPYNDRPPAGRWSYATSRPLLRAEVCQSCGADGPWVEGADGRPACERCGSTSAMVIARQLGRDDVIAAAGALGHKLGGPVLGKVAGFVADLVLPVPPRGERRPATKPVKAVMLPRKSAGGSRRGRSPGKGGS